MTLDDIRGVGSKENVEQIIDNCIELEMKKKMTFSTEKSQYNEIWKKRTITN